MKKRILLIILSSIFVFVGVFGFGGCDKQLVDSENILSYNEDDAIIFDYSARDGTKTQYIKKFDQFATTWGFVGDQPGYIRTSSINQLSALKELNAESLRFDLFMGYTGLGYNIGRTSTQNGSTDAEYEQMMQVVRELEEQSVLPQLVVFACPAYAQSYGSWKSKPIAEKWQELCHNMAAYFKNKDIRIGAYEIWNEPDLGTEYFDGTWEDYIDTYISGAKGIKSADSDAFVEGMSASWIHKICSEKESGQQMTKWERFISRTAQENVLPDSISWHFYGREGELENIVGLGGDGENFSVYRNAILNALTTTQTGTSENDDTVYTELATMQQNLNEFNIYQPLAESSAEMWNSAQVVPGMFNAIETLLAANDITRVNWATFLSEQRNGVGCSSIDTYSLQRYAAYHVNWMYGRLPVNRIIQPELENGLETFAAADNGRAGIIVYNTADQAKSAKIAFRGIPFEKGNVSVYLVDDEHITYSSKNEPYLAGYYKEVDVNRLTADLSLQKNAVYYIEINAADGKQSDLEYDNALRENIVRKDYYYPQRGDCTPYSEIHENSLTAYVAMNGNQEGTSASAVTLNGLSLADALTLDYETWGDPKAGENAALGLKLDFQTTEGYTKSVYYAFDGFETDITLPFGTEKKSSSVISLGSLDSGTVNIDLKQVAPDGWTGQMVVSYLIQNAGPEAVAKFVLY